MDQFAAAVLEETMDRLWPFPGTAVAPKHTANEAKAVARRMDSLIYPVLGPVACDFIATGLKLPLSEVRFGEWFRHHIALAPFRPARIPSMCRATPLVDRSDSRHAGSGTRCVAEWWI